MDKEKVNKALKRVIKDGAVFDKYIAKPPHQKQELDKGDTFHTTKMMKIWAIRHYKQVELLAQKLQGRTLDETCLNIHSFLYNYIQYEIDGSLQQLRSPANSWHTARETGIDCKSYSIFASCILLNLGIKHYIRQIKQPNMNPKNFSHVYVVVPLDQVTGSFANGNYCIDGTLKTSLEPRFTEAKDIFMAKLEHIGLNGAEETYKVSLRKSKSFKGDDRYVVYVNNKAHLDGKPFYKEKANDIAKALRRLHKKKTNKKGLNATKPTKKTASSQVYKIFR